MKTFRSLSIKMALTIFLTAILFISNAQPIKPTAKGYAPVNGMRMYYEIYGQGSPVVLLHGSFMNINANYGALIPHLAKNHQVIAVEMQGHGRTADIDRVLSYKALAADVAGMLSYLKIDSAAIIGYSLGATVALQTAISNPQKVTKLVFISSVYKTDGWIKPVRDAFAMMTPEMLAKTPLRAMYNSLAPDTGRWKTFAGKYIKLENTPYNLGIENIRRLKMPVLIIKGDNDGVDYGHISEMYQALGGGIFGDMMPMPKSKLAVVPGTNHVSLMMDTNDLKALIIPFIQ